MSITVHRHYAVTLTIVCALLLLSSAPSVSKAQEVQETPPESVAPLNTAPPYPVERIEGNNLVSGDFVVGPGKVDVSIAPGKSRTVEMLVTNRTGETRTFSMTVEDATGSYDPERPIILLGDDRGPYSLKDYISFPHDTFELKQGERARVPVTISIPQNADPGGLYGSVLVQTVTIEDTNTTGENPAPRSAIIARIGTLFFVTVEGEVTREGKLQDFTTIPDKKYFQSGPVTFGILFENTGPIHLAPYGEIRIHNMLGKEVGFVELEPWFALPESLRLREIEWNRDLLFGKYTAVVKVNRSYSDIIDTASVTFWVVPWQWILGGFAILFVILFLIRAFFRNFEFKRKER